VKVDRAVAHPKSKVAHEWPDGREPLELACSQLVGRNPVTSARPTHLVATDIGELRSLDRDQLLFRAGDERTHFFCVRSGLIGLYVKSDGLQFDYIDFASSGRMLGLGFLDRHFVSARVVFQSSVTSFPIAALPSLAQADAQVQNQQNEAVVRDFAARREAVLSNAPTSPLARVAAFLVAISHLNSREGRDPYCVHDSLTCGVTAEYLRITIDVLAEQLIALRELRLIENSDQSGLRLIDLHGLECLAETSKRHIGSNAP
jgi:CRP/FNR family transcriptional regulator